MFYIHTYVDKLHPDKYDLKVSRKGLETFWAKIKFTYNVVTSTLTDSLKSSVYTIDPVNKNPEGSLINIVIIFPNSLTPCNPILIKLIVGKV